MDVEDRMAKRQARRDARRTNFEARLSESRPSMVVPIAGLAILIVLATVGAIAVMLSGTAVTPIDQRAAAVPGTVPTAAEGASAAQEELFTRTVGLVVCATIIRTSKAVFEIPAPATVIDSRRENNSKVSENEREDPFGPYAHGSGVLVSPAGHMLTNYHVVSQHVNSVETAAMKSANWSREFGTEVSLEPTVFVFFGGVQYQAKLVRNYRSEKIDYALLQLIPDSGPPGPYPYLPLHAAVGEAPFVSRGVSVAACGFPGRSVEPLLPSETLETILAMRTDSGKHVRDFFRQTEFDYYETRGVVTKLMSTDGVEYVMTDATISHGNSGGPLVDLATSSVVGLNVLGVVDELQSARGGGKAVIVQGYGRAVSVRTIYAEIAGELKQNGGFDTVGGTSP